MKLTSLIPRALSGLIYVGIIVGCIFLGIYPFSLLALLFGVLAVIEFKKICSGISQSTLPLIILDVAGVACLTFSWLIFPFLIWICIYIARITLELYAKENNPIKSLSSSLMTQIYIGLPLAAMTFIGKAYGLHLIFAVFLMIWINDTGAYLIGSTCGKNRLFERISPKKSWEGFFGGLGFNLLAGWLFSLDKGGFWDVNWSSSTWLLFGALVSVFSTWGDLIESLIKRSLNIKDSGNLIPGHGGILDRIDSLLLVMPAVLMFIIAWQTLHDPSFPVWTAF